MIISGYVFVTQQLMEDIRKVNFMYREQPENPNDSGWRFFCGCEDQAYVDNPDNIVLCSIEDILLIDNSIKPFLCAAPGLAFEWCENSNSFKLTD